MTQLGEMVAIGFVNEKKVECPFHDDEHTCDTSVRNELEGNAEILGKKLASSKISDSTVLRNDKKSEPYKSAFKQELDPDENYNLEARHVLIHEDIDCAYPVAYAAHHLIPAGASLKKADSLLPYIENKKGKICCNLGYDVNGNENGIWLPGLHAVNSNGINKWSGASPKLPDNERWKRLVALSTKRKYLPLEGSRPSKSPDKAYQVLNMKWLYVQAAMAFKNVGKRQFHDAHPNYSNLVKKALNDVGNLLKRLSSKNTKEKLEPSCPTCKENRKNKKKIIPPLGLLGLLNNTSQHLKNQYILNKTQHNEYYTSTWCGPRPKQRKRK